MWIGTAIVALILQLSSQGTEAIICYDCTSWNPYCYETVETPFPEAVAIVDCNITNKCFVRKEINGMISRGCADGWMFSSIETNYVGCREQALPWNQPQDWCLCQGNLCNSKSMSDIGGRRGEGPQIKLKEDTQRLPIGKSGNENSHELQASSTSSSVTQKVLPWWWWYVNWSTEKGQAVQATTPRPTTTTTTTVAPTYPPDSKPILPWWWWYVHWSTEKPSWLWQENTDYNDYGEKANNVEEGTQTTQSLYPWWIGRHSTMQPLAPSTVDWETWPNNPPGVDERNKLKQQDKAIEKAADNVTLKKDMTCWDCFSQNPHCGDIVSTPVAYYVGRTPCPASQKCFVRRDGEETYRGCADGWISSSVDIDYLGCKVQYLWGKKVEWCFCDSELCNGDSITAIAALNGRHDAIVQPDDLLRTLPEGK